MSKGQQFDPITIEDVRAAFKKRGRAERDYIALLSEYHVQRQVEDYRNNDKQKGVSKISVPEPIEKEESPKKSKKQGWLCHGNIKTKAPCPLSPQDQVPDSGTRHEQHTYNTCTICKKAIARTKQEEKKKKKNILKGT